MARPPEDVAAILRRHQGIVLMDENGAEEIDVPDVADTIDSLLARIGELEGALKQIAGGKDDHDQPLSARLLMEFAYTALSERNSKGTPSHSKSLERDDGPNTDPLPPEDDPHPDLPGGA